MQAQISIFDIIEEPSVKWLEVTKTPSINWLFDNAALAFNDLKKHSEKDFVKIWKAIGIANYMFIRGMEPKGFVHSRHKHIMHQIGSQELVDKVSVEFNVRGLNHKIGLDIDLRESTQAK